MERTLNAHACHAGGGGACEAKVADLDGAACAVDEDVVALDVSVNDRGSSGMEIRNACEDLLAPLSNRLDVLLDNPLFLHAVDVIAAERVSTTYWNPVPQLGLSAAVGGEAMSQTR